MLSRSSRGPWWLDAALAVASAALAVGATMLLRLQHQPFLLPMVAVIVIALRTGLVMGLVSGVSTLFLANYFLIPPLAEFSMPSLLDAYGLAVFTVTAAVVSLLAGHRRTAQLTLEATLASIGDGVIVADKEARVRFLNLVAQELTGWSNEDATGQPVEKVFNVITEETRRPVAAPIERALREQIVVGLAAPAVLIARNGNERPISDSGAPIRDRSGRVIGAVLVFSDATAQRRTELTLKRQAAEREELLVRERDARAEAERANRLKDEFLATLSHELRTPLNAVLGWSHMLTRRQLTVPQQTQAIAAIHRNAQAQARLVDDVLDLSRIVTGRMALGAETVNLSDIVRATAESFTPAIVGRAQDLRLDMTTDAEIIGDSHRIRQIVWNLVSNAMKFTPDGGVISLRVVRVGGRVELTVSDTGQGIEPGFLPYVFDRFRQGDGSSTRGHGGLGLGLALVRHLVEAHGGTVYATSAGIGKGATVVVRFPARVPRVRLLSGENSADTPPAAAAARGRQEAGPPESTAIEPR